MGLLLNVLFSEWKDSLSRFRNGATCSIYPTYPTTLGRRDFFPMAYKLVYKKVPLFSNVLKCLSFRQAEREKLLECSTRKFLVVYLDAKQIDNILNKFVAVRGQCYTSLVFV